MTSILYEINNSEQPIINSVKDFLMDEISALVVYDKGMKVIMGFTSIVKIKIVNKV